MKYENARDILPKEILLQVQKYAEGKLLYIPVANDSKDWGEVSGYRQKLMRRNLMICNKYANGKMVSELADEYFLSIDSIKKIIYSKKEKELLFSPSFTSALKYAKAGMAEEWIQSYVIFCTDCRTKNTFSCEEVISLGVVKIPLRFIQCQCSREDYNKPNHTYAPTNKETEPLIVRYENNKFYVDFQVDLVVALKNSKVNSYPAFILVPNKGEYGAFMQNYGKHFIVFNE